MPYPELYFDHRSIKINSSSVCDVKAVVSDRNLLVTSANLTDSDQLKNFELGVKIENQFSSDATWDHFDKLIKEGMLKKYNYIQAKINLHKRLSIFLITNE